MATEIFWAGDVDSEDESVPFSNRDAARAWAVIEFEAVYEIDTAELRFEWQKPTPELLTRYGLSERSEFEFMVVTELRGTPESWGETAEQLSWSLFVRSESVYDSVEEANEHVQIVTIPISNTFEGGEYEA